MRRWTRPRFIVKRYTPTGRRARCAFWCRSRLTVPVDSARPTLYLGEAQILTNMGPLPISFEVDALTLAEAVANYGEAAKSRRRPRCARVAGIAPPGVVVDRPAGRRHYRRPDRSTAARGAWQRQDQAAVTQRWSKLRYPRRGSIDHQTRAIGPSTLQRRPRLTATPRLGACGAAPWRVVAPERQRKSRFFPLAQCERPCRNSRPHSSAPRTTTSRLPTVLPARCGRCWTRAPRADLVILPADGIAEAEASGSFATRDPSRSRPRRLSAWP